MENKSIETLMTEIELFTQRLNDSIKDSFDMKKILMSKLKLLRSLGKDKYSIQVGVDYFENALSFITGYGYDKSLKILKDGVNINK